MHETFLLLHDYTTIISRNPWRKNISWRKTRCFERNLINIPPLHSGAKSNKKVSLFTKMLQLRYQRKVTWARFARTGWVTKSGNSNPVYVTMSGISPVSMITTRSHNHHLVHIADQFADAVSTIIQSWGLALYIFYKARFVHWEFSTWFWRGAVVTLTFMLHCLLQ